MKLIMESLNIYCIYIYLLALAYIYIYIYFADMSSSQ